MVSLTLAPRSVLVLFFVKEKDNKLRLIVDCRRTNSLFRAPPGVELLSGDGLSRIEAQVDSPSSLADFAVCLGVGDVADCFHRMKLSAPIRSHFAWPGLAAKHLQIQEVNGESVQPNQLVWPICN